MEKRREEKKTGETKGIRESFLAAPKSHVLLQLVLEKEKKEKKEKELCWQASSIEIPATRKKKSFIFLA